MNFSRPSQLPTPPETDSDFLAGGHHAVDLMNASGIHGADLDLNLHPSSFAGVPLRRVSTLAYHNSPLRDSRERPNVRQSRWLVITIPPPSLVQDHGPLGHTLTSGPSQRLSQGIVMPLQPTMYSQLNAIAREFNFPSPVGLCLYLHVTEHGITMTPRISDEIWSALWGHLFEARSPASASQMPICGRIEFDIDRRKARWFDSWLNSDRRHAADVPVSVPPSLSHWREDSKNSFFDERGDERPEAPSGLQTEPRSRHKPKKLSLVDRLEALSLTSSTANAIAGNGAVHALATVLHEDEPKPAKIALEKRVESWRASSSVAPTPMATTSPTSFDPPHVPNNIQLSDIDILADTDGADADGIDLNDFTWSPSSAGPPDYHSLASPISGSHVPSVPLDRRLEGSVLLTPSTATSWGVQTLDHSPMSALFRLPSPDIGQRVTEDCPPTPSTATSWGPEELLYSPASVTFRLPSPDLGLRMLEDCPPTPTTVTLLSEELLHPPTSRLPPLNLGMLMLGIWPYTSSIHSNGDSPTTEIDMSGTSDIVGLHPNGHVFPYFSAPTRPAWTFVWPFFTAENASKPLPSQFPFQGRVIETYNVANHIRDVQSLEATSIYLEGSYPIPVIYLLVYPYLSISFPRHVGQAMKQEVEPFLMHDSSIINLQLRTQYPYFDLYPAGYPSNLTYIYPTEVRSRSATSLLVRLPLSYPAMEIYPPQYPFVTPYPPKTIFSSTEVDQTLDSAEFSRSRQAQSVYLDEDAPMYPAFDIYPAVAGPSKAAGIDRHLQVYPRIILYPAVYPELDLYPPVFAEETGSIQKTDVTSQYPHLRIYPAVYPWFEIYPGHVSTGENGAVASRVTLQSAYPQFDIYPAVYPHFDIYRTGSPKKEDEQAPLLTMLPAQYPALSLYPPVYPHIEIFPPVTKAYENRASTQHPTLAGERITASTHVSFRRVRRTHRELHEEVFGAGAPVNESVGQTIDKLLGGTQARGRTRSKSIIAHPAVPQATSLPLSSLPPIPPLPMSQPLSLRIPFHNAEARHNGLSTPPSEASSPSVDRPTSSQVTHSSPISNGGSIARSNSYTTANTSPRKDHGHSKQSHRPRDSLVLEKARYFEHLRSLSFDDRSLSVVDELANLPAPPVPQLPFEVPQPQTLNHTKNPLA